MNSQIFQGTVQHRRFSEKYHHFKYHIYMMCLDLSELNDVFKPYWFWSTQRFNIVSFKRKLYLGNKKQSLLQSAKALIKEKTGNDIDQVFLLTNLAYFGYCFNPISVYFCLKEGALLHCIAEVTNTPWGEVHPYILTPTKVNDDIYTMTFKKVLHVSPFLDMDYHYQFHCKYNKDNIILHIKNIRNDSCDFDATLNLQARTINHVNLAKTLIKFPFMTGKVIVAIYWQALKLWIKGVKFRTHQVN